MTARRPPTNKQLLNKFHRDWQDARVVAAQPDAMYGEQSPEFRLSRLKEEFESVVKPAIIALQKPIDLATELKKDREEIIHNGTAELERRMIREGRLEAGRHIRLGPEDKQALLASTKYYEKLDTEFMHLESLFSVGRALKNFVRTFEVETTELAMDVSRNKMQALLGAQHQPAIDPTHADLEALVTCPIEKKRAKRAMSLQENALNGEAVSAERKAKLLPKPKAKTRAPKRVKPGDATAPGNAAKRVRKPQAQPAAAPQPESSVAAVSEADEAEVLEHSSESEPEEFQLWS